MQFHLRSLFHLCCLVSAGSIAASGAVEGKPAKIVLPMFVLGACYTTIVAYRLRKTIARFAWDVAKFVFCWFFLTIYGVFAVAHVHALHTRTWFPEPLIRSVTWGLAPLAIYCAYCVAMTYWRAKIEPEEDLC